LKLRVIHELCQSLSIEIGFFCFSTFPRRESGTVKPPRLPEVFEKREGLGANYVSAYAAIYGTTSYFFLPAGQRGNQRPNTAAHPSRPACNNGHLGKNMRHPGLPARGFDRVSGRTSGKVK